MSVMKRMSLIFNSKANKALDRMEDPRETLDYSYQQQLELLQKVRRGVADVATSRKRLELQMNPAAAAADKLDGAGASRRWAQAARTSPARRSPAGRPCRPRSPTCRPSTLAPGRGGEAHAGLAAAAGQGRRLPHAEGDHQGHLHRGRGADQDRRGVLRHLRGDGRRRPGDPARRRTRPRRCRRGPAPSTSCSPPARWMTYRHRARRHPGRARPDARRPGRRTGAGAAEGRARRARRSGRSRAARWTARRRPARPPRPSSRRPVRSS